MITLQAPPYIKGECSVPSSKSIANRFLTLILLEQPQTFEIQWEGTNNDINVFLNAIKHFYKLTLFPKGVRGERKKNFPQSISIDLQDCGSAYRFLTAAMSFLPVKTVFSGTPRLAQRPIQPLIQTLQQAGKKISYKPNTFPKVIGSQESKTKVFTLKGTLKSSQLVSALLLLAPCLVVGTTIEVKNYPSPSYVQMTLSVLRQWGYKWRRCTKGFVLESKPLVTQHRFCKVEGDWSAASYLFALAATGKSKIFIHNLNYPSYQGDSRLFDFFQSLGLQCYIHHNGIAIKNDTGNLIVPFSVDCYETPDLAPTYAVLSVFKTGEYLLKGLQTLAYKESNRSAVLKKVLTQIGCKVEENKSSLMIKNIGHCRSLPYFPVYQDHRIAMSFAILARYFPVVVISSPEVVDKSFPTFWQVLRTLGVNIKTSNLLGAIKKANL